MRKKLLKSDEALSSTPEGLGRWLVVFLGGICFMLQAHTSTTCSQLLLLPNISLNTSD